ncbi:ricin-type beta-trefoil lectin domain protein [Dactylosporangium sp. NPDC051485]|uniref:RICIN domain-containing protein n=1 Tax=Dactylosporangium sp. NPDC051485 TaxID=3154846 RepID=UPI003420E2A2
MSVAGDGKDADEPGGQPASSRARHRVAPTTSTATPVLPQPFTPDKPTIPAIPHPRRPDGPTAVAWAAVPEAPAPLPVFTPKPSDRALPEPFTPARPTIPDVPHQRRPDGPTAVATAAIPAVPVPGPDEPDPDTVDTLAGEARADAAELLDPADDRTFEFIVTLPGVTNDPELAEPSPVAGLSSAAEPELVAKPQFKPKPVAAPEPVAAPQPEPVAAREAEAKSELVAAPQPELVAEPQPAPEAKSEPELVAEVEAEPIETVEGELLPVGVLPADDSPTLADYEPPALAIVAEVDPDDAADYRGSRRRTTPWRRFPVGAVAVAVLILLITAGVAIQVLRRDSSGGGHDNGLSSHVPGVSVPPAPTPQAGNAGPSPEGSPSASASPSASRTRSASPSASRAPSASAAPGSASASPPPVPAPTSGRLMGKQSGKCVEYRTQRSSTTVLLNTCDPRGTNQHWRAQGDLNTGATLLTDAGKCLDVQNAGTGNGNAVWAFDCNGSGAQKWIRHANNTWENPNSRRCLDASGTSLIIWDCRGTDNQIWSLG